MIYGEQGKIPNPLFDLYQMTGSGFWVPKPGVRFTTGKTGTLETDTRAIVPEYTSHRDSAKVMGAAILEGVRTVDVIVKEMTQIVFDEAINEFSRNVVEDDRLYQVVLRMIDMFESEEGEDFVVAPWQSHDGMIGIQVCMSSHIENDAVGINQRRFMSMPIGTLQGGEMAIGREFASTILKLPKDSLDTLTQKDLAHVVEAGKSFWAYWNGFHKTCEENELKLVRGISGSPELATTYSQNTIKGDDSKGDYDGGSQ